MIWVLAMSAALYMALWSMHIVPWGVVLPVEMLHVVGWAEYRATIERSIWTYGDE